MSDTLPDWVVPGASFRLSHDDGRTHVRGIVDGQAVLRNWSKRRQRWIYRVEDPIWFDSFSGHIRDVKRPSISDETIQDGSCDE